MKKQIQFADTSTKRALTIAGASAAYSISEQMLRLAIRRRELTCARVGRRILIFVSDLENFIRGAK
jgi:hypothetical protein